MATTREEIRQWFLEGQRGGKTHMVVVCDTFDHEDYPVYVYPNGNVHEVVEAYDGKNMQRVMEVYALFLDMEGQLAERRAFHLDTPPLTLHKEDSP